MAFFPGKKLVLPNLEDERIDLTNQHEDRSFLRTALAWKGSVTPKIIQRVFIAGLYATLILFIGSFFPSIHLSITPFEYSGAVLGLLLVARVNAGVGRWWEARKIWGNIVNQSRNLAIIGYSYPPLASLKKVNILGWIAIWPYTMKEQLRNERELKEGIRLLPPNQVGTILSANHMPLYVGLKIASILKALRSKGLDDFSFHRAERERSLLIDAIGACERIKTTPMPFALAIKTRRFILLFLALLPFALVDKVGFFTPFIVMLTAYPLFSLDEIGMVLQDPFSKTNLSHLPLNAICKNIEKNVLSLQTMQVSTELEDEVKENVQTKPTLENSEIV